MKYFNVKCDLNKSNCRKKIKLHISNEYEKIVTIFILK
jgi:hypothetical protein